MASSSAFVSHNNVLIRPAQKPLHMMSGDAVSSISSSTLAHFNNMLIATIDSDIASVPENEFAPIFAGGILVMFGGVVSALIVGFILESNDSYANVIADSYAQGAEDEEFWKGLSEEEKKKTQELLQKIRDSKEGGAKPTPAPAPAPASQANVHASTAEVPKREVNENPKESAPAKDPGMFSDY
jgi:hypothetical protein